MAIGMGNGQSDTGTDQKPSVAKDKTARHYG